MYWSLKEAELPPNVDPLDPKIDDPETRTRMVRTFERGLSTPSGFVLPIQRWNAEAKDHRWQSERWKLRRGKLFLVPGDSPLGFRLPLSALPYVEESEYPYVLPQDPTEPRPPLPTHEQLAQVYNQGGSSAEANADRQTRIEQVAVLGAVRTALSIEPRDGVICAFMPPVEKLEDYLDLLAAIEAKRARNRQTGSRRGLSAARRSAP